MSRNNGDDTTAPSVDRLPPHSIEAERAVLGAVLLSPSVVMPLLISRIQGGEVFYELKHQMIYELYVQMHDAAETIDLVTLSDWLNFQEKLEAVGGTPYLASLSDACPSALSAESYLEILEDHYRQRKLIQVCSRTVGSVYDHTDDVNTLVDWTAQELLELSSRSMQVEEEPIADLVSQAIDDIERVHTNQGAITGLATGFVDFDKMTCGLEPGQMIIIAARPSMGKAQPHSSAVLTAEGFRPLGSMLVGEAVIGRDGKEKVISGIYPQGVIQVFKVDFSDGTSTVCSADHLWFTQTRNERRRGIKGSVKTLADVAQTLRRGDGANCNHAVPTCCPVEFFDDQEHKNNRKLDAWLLGALLGDGQLKNGNIIFSKPEVDIQERVLAVLPPCDTGVVNGMDIRIKRKKRDNTISGTKIAIEQLGLSLFSEYKFIPRAYLFAPSYQRLELLRGILDTDGYVTDTGTAVEFSTSSKQLADGVAFIARSLGGICSCAKPRIPSFTYKGEKKLGKLSHRMNIWFSNGLIPVSSKKHLLKWKLGPSRRVWKSIVSVTADGFKESSCIMLDDPEGLYLTDDFIVTHNTSLAMNIAEHVAVDAGIPVGVFSLEMTRRSLVTRMLCSRARVNLRHVRDGFLSQAAFPRLTGAAVRIRNAPLFINDAAGLSILGLRSRARRMQQQHSIRLFVIDYIQLLSADRNRNDSRQNEVSAISGGIKALAKELGVPVIALSQLNRKLEDDKNRRPRLADLRESGSLEQDADLVGMLYRPKTHDEEESDEAVSVNLFIAKQRNGPTGDIPLTFLKGFTRFESAAKVSSEDNPSSAPPDTEPMDQQQQPDML